MTDAQPVLPPVVARILARLGSAVQRVLRAPLLAGLPKRHDQGSLWLYPRPVTLHQLPALTREFPVLCSDDDVQLLAGLADVLAIHDLGVVTTPSPLETLRLCAEAGISLVVTDIMKPEMSGIAMVQQMQQHPAMRRIPVIFLTASGVQDCGAEAARLGAVDYLQKPVDADEFLYSVRTALVQCGNFRAPRRPVMRQRSWR